MIRKSKSKEIWPNFFIVGAAKAGTTSLYNYLKDLPEVYMSSLKEPGYFLTSDDIPYPKFMNLIQDKEKYFSFFKDVKNEIAIGEATALYLWDLDSANYIHQVVPNAKIIIILRNPVERAYSNFLMLRQTNENLSFHGAIHRNFSDLDYDLTRNYLELGFYAKQVKKYLDVFGEKNVKILIFEEFVDDVTHTLKDVLTFLGVKYKTIEVSDKYNPYLEPRTILSKYILSSEKIRKITKVIPKKIRKNVRDNVLLKEGHKPPIADKDRAFLKELYLDDVKKLEHILRRKLPWQIK